MSCHAPCRDPIPALAIFSAPIVLSCACPHVDFFRVVLFSCPYREREARGEASGVLAAPRSALCSCSLSYFLFFFFSMPSL